MEERKIANLLNPCGPWYCKCCVGEFEEAGVKYVMLGLELMHYLAMDELPDDD